MNPAVNQSISTLYWVKTPHVRNMWESEFISTSGNRLVLAVFGKVEPPRSDAKLISMALDVQDTLHLWEGKIVQELSRLSPDITLSNSKGSLTLSRLLFDGRDVLSAIYLETPHLHGHRAVVEFNEEGEPYEAEITS